MDCGLPVADGVSQRERACACGLSMVQLTRLNNKPLMLNSDLIKFVEQAPDTVVTLITGEKVVVLEKAAEVLARIIEFRRAVLQGLSLAGDASSAQAWIARSPRTGTSETEGKRG
jgi:flagellar protein FlbD